MQMRAWLLVLVACSSAPQPRPEPAPIANATSTCADAALGLEAATKGVRAPERGVFEELKRRCVDDTWPGTAVDCFARMREGELGRCARELPEASREKMFGVLADRAGLAIARARLEQLTVGVAACDRFVGAVTTMLGCEGMALDDRVQLGNETAQFWSLPTDRLGEDDLRRMSAVCEQSLVTLQQQAATVGCMP